MSTYIAKYLLGKKAYNTALLSTCRKLWNKLGKNWPTLEKNSVQTRCLDMGTLLYLRSVLKRPL